MAESGSFPLDNFKSFPNLMSGGGEHTRGLRLAATWGDEEGPEHLEGSGAPRRKETRTLNRPMENQQTRSTHTGTLQDPGQSTRCAPPPASWAVCHTAGWVYLTPGTPGPRLKKYSHQFFSRLQSPFLPAYIFQYTLCSHAAGVFSNK